MLTLGIDLGGTKVRTALVDSAGWVVATDLRPTEPSRGPDGVVAGIVAAAAECVSAREGEVLGIGIGVAGQVDGDDGVVRFAPNLGWENVPLRAAIEEAAGLPVFVTNDVRAATFGEWRYGAGTGAGDLVCLFVGTGIGGGVVSGGRLLEGASHSGGELGHMTIVAGGRRCHCPNRGCVEAYAGGWAIAERAQEAVREDPDLGQPLIAGAGSVDNITPALVGAACRDGDPLARRLVHETADYLSAAAVGLVNAFNPAVLILGGGVIEGIPEIIVGAAENVRRYALPAAVKPLRIARSALAGAAGAVGAAVLAREKLTANKPI